MAEKRKRDSESRTSRGEVAGVNKELQHLGFSNPGPKALVVTDSQRGEMSKREERKYQAFLLSDARNRRSSSRDSKEQITSERKREARQPTKPSKPKATKTSVSTTYDSHGLLNGKDLCDCSCPQCEGCWMECSNCRSTKCGTICRCNRSFQFSADFEEESADTFLL